MTFSDSVRTCLQKYAVFSGRAGRSEFWWFTVFCVAVSWAAEWLDEGFHLELDGIPAFVATGVIGLVTALALLVPSLAVGVRRLHDTGRSGWWMLLLLVPCLGLLVLIAFFCLSSQPQPNQYGEPPLQTGSRR